MKMNRYKALVYLLAGIFMLNSCKKDIPPVPTAQQLTSGGSGFVYILNEGNFMASNGSVTRLNLNDGMVFTDYYAAQNTNLTLGDVPQSMCEHNGKFYIVVNNSGKVVCVDKYSFQKQSQLSGFNSPRFFLPVSGNKAYVSDLYANAISVVDLSNFSIVNSIPLTGWSEEMIERYGKVFVTNKTSSFVYVLNTITDQLIDSIPTGYGPCSLCEDKNGKLWILCQGNSTQNLQASLLRINPITNTIDTSYDFTGSSHHPSCLRINGPGDVLYYLDSDGVYRMPINGGIPLNAHISQGNRNFYGLGIDPQNEMIYIADAIDFNQNGKIFRYNSSGSELDSFNSGIIPGFFYFDK